jgi:hypothetical protein
MDLPDVFGRAEADACGVGPSELRWLLRRGHCQPLPYGGYALTALVEACNGDAAARHRLDVRGRLLTGPRGAVAGHWSAVVAHDLPMLGRPPSRPVLTRDGGGSSHDRFLKVATLPAEEVTVVNAVRSTTVDRLLVDVSRRAAFRAAVVTADAALRQGLDPAVLKATAQRWSAWPYGRRPVLVADFADGRAETPIESLGRVALHEQGVDPPELQVEVWLGDALVARVDHLWERYAVIGEADGMLKYDQKDVLREEKRRQERLEQLGLVVVRYDWDDAYRRQWHLAERVRAAFARGRPDSLHPGVRLVRTQPRVVVPKAA